jgi:hypothetical protein
MICKLITKCGCTRYMDVSPIAYPIIKVPLMEPFTLKEQPIEAIRPKGREFEYRGLNDCGLIEYREVRES